MRLKFDINEKPVCLTCSGRALARYYGQLGWLLDNVVGSFILVCRKPAVVMTVRPVLRIYLEMTRE